MPHPPGFFVGRCGELPRGLRLGSLMHDTFCLGGEAVWPSVKGQRLGFEALAVGDESPRFMV